MPSLWETTMQKRRKVLPALWQRDRLTTSNLKWTLNYEHKDINIVKIEYNQPVIKNSHRISCVFHRAKACLQARYMVGVPILPATNYSNLIIILLLQRRPFSHGGIQNLLADPQIHRSDLQQLVGVYKVQSLLQA